MQYQTTTIGQSPEYREALTALHHQAWPEFLNHADGHHWEQVLRRFADYQLLFVAQGDLAGAGCTVPLHWDNRQTSLPCSIEEVLIKAIGCHEIGKPANTLIALAVWVSNRYRGNGLTADFFRIIKQWAADSGLASVAVPVRPTSKSQFPLTPFEQYVNWKNTDGSPFDPWLSMHWKLGAKVMRIAPKALTVEGSIAQWEQWTGMRFDKGGEYIVDGALQPVLIDRTNDYGRYEDPNLWMLHPLHHTHNPSKLSRGQLDP